MNTFRNILKESIKSDKLSKEIDKSMEKIDDSMDVKDFALATAKILNEQYGKLNFDTFIKILKQNLDK